MDSDITTSSAISGTCCDCGCSCSVMNRSFSGNMLRSVKRKLDEFEGGNSQFLIPGINFPLNARVEVENECALLREMVSNQQQTIQDLSLELEEERNASSSAANEAMSMILRLQREKAEIQMEARQFKRFAEEKMAHDQQEFMALEDVLYKREQAIQSLTCEVQMYKHRMLSYGFTEAEADGENKRNGMMSCNNSTAGNSEYDYPSLKCNLNENQIYSEADNEVVDVEKYAFEEDTPRSRDHLKDLEYRINQLERSPRGNQPEEYFGTKNVLEKVIVGHSPRPRHLRKLSNDSSNSFFTTGREVGPDFATDSPKFGASFRKTEYFQQMDNSNLRKVDNASDDGDDTSDRVYTIDSVHQQATAYNGITEHKASVVMSDDYVTTPRDSLANTNIGDPDIQKLYMRLHALEADRESMRQAIISMRTDKAQLILLKEIAQNLCKEMSPVQKPLVRKPSLIGSFSVFSVFKVVITFCCLVVVSLPLWLALSATFHEN